MEDFVTFEIAKKLKEKGFPQHWSNDDYIVENEYEDNFEVGSHYDRCFIPEHLPTVAAPTISQALKWLREEKKMHIEIFLYNGKYGYLVNSITQICEEDLFHKCLNEDTANEEYITYEVTVFAGIEYVLDNLI